MNKFSSVFFACLFLIGLLIASTSVSHLLFDNLSLYSEKVNQGEYWRLLTANFVHFGWIHTAMNAAALLLCVLAFFTDYSLKHFSFLLIWCCAGVGLGIYFLNLEYSPYAGLSGAIHGLIVAGLLQTRAYPLWIRVIVLSLLVAKLVDENGADYAATELQALLPVAVAVESHLYGALAGLAFAGVEWLLQRIKRNA